MGMASMGLARAEAQTTNAVVATDRVVIQRYTSFTNQNNYWQPLEATVGEISSLATAGLTIVGAGQATLVAGTVTVANTAVLPTSKILVTPVDATPNAIGVTVSSGVSFTLTSASGADTSVVNYLIIN